MDSITKTDRPKRVLILGIDGYIGYSLAQHLLDKGHTIGGIDDQLRRYWVSMVGSFSATDIASFSRRHGYLLDTYPDRMSSLYEKINIAKDSFNLREAIKNFKPDVIYNLAHQPSAPFSMINSYCSRVTQENNILGGLNVLFSMKEVCPDAHLITIGSMGEYGTPPVPIPEGSFPVGSMWESPLGTFPIDGMVFPKDSGSFYHLSKSFISMNTRFACKVWGLTSTDVMQGIVYGFHGCGPDPYAKESISRLDIDQCFGTVIHRFVAQAITGLPMIVHGTGSQRRGFLHINQSLECLAMLMDNPPEKGGYRPVNQFAEVRSVAEIAEIIQGLEDLCDNRPSIANVKNPRVESENHPYSVTTDILSGIGFRSTATIEEGIKNTMVEFRKSVDPATKMEDQLQKSSIEWRSSINIPANFSEGMPR